MNTLLAVSDSEAIVPWMSFFLLVAFALASAAVGAALAHWFERDPVIAAGRSFFLGPIGWLCELLWEDERPICHECCGRMGTCSRRCRHCGQERPRPAPPPMPTRRDTTPMALPLPDGDR